jgi:predicted site-specific integrase-resolvase
MDRKNQLQAYRRRLGVMKRWCFTPLQAANELGVTRWTIYYHLRKGNLRRRSLGGRIFIAKWEVENLKRKGENGHVAGNRNY